jgi:integrase
MEADTEEEQGIRWKRRKLKHRLIHYMNYCKENMEFSAAKSYVTKIKGFYHHHEIEIGNLPKWNLKNAKIHPPIKPDDLPTKEIIRQALEISSPLMRAIILTLVSTGMSRADLLRLKIKDFLTSTYQYHQKDTIQEAIPILLKTDDIIPILENQRVKNNKYYFTFMTPEAVTEICNYLLIRDKRNHKYHRPLIKPEDPLFKISDTTYGDKFVEINNTLKLGKKGTYNRFRSHMLRKYHATELEKQGMPREHIRTLQGKSNTKVDEAYFYIDTETLRKEYIESMSGLLMYTEVKTIDNYSEEYLELKRQNEEYQSNMEAMWKELNNIKERQSIWENMKKRD